MASPESQWRQRTHTETEPKRLRFEIDSLLESRRQLTGPGRNDDVVEFFLYPDAERSEGANCRQRDEKKKQRILDQSLALRFIVSSVTQQREKYL